jgi:glutamyl-tRNA reductase
MALVLLGINHNTASIDLREKVAFPPEIVGDAISKLKAMDHVDEAIIVSTCNRTELYLETSQVITVTLTSTKSVLVEWLAEFHQLSAEELMQCSYCYWHEDVVRHLMKVSCGLDSMVLGEPQILGQIKSAFAVSKGMNAVGVNLSRAFEEAFSIAKEVRTDTAIG